MFWTRVMSFAVINSRSVAAVASVLHRPVDFDANPICLHVENRWRLWGHLFFSLSFCCGGFSSHMDQISPQIQNKVLNRGSSL